MTRALKILLKIQLAMDSKLHRVCFLKTADFFQNLQHCDWDRAADFKHYAGIKPTTLNFKIIITHVNGTQLIYYTKNALRFNKPSCNIFHMYQNRSFRWC